MKTKLIAALAGVMLASPAAAQVIIDGSDIEDVVNSARGFGAATLTNDDNGPAIRGRIDGFAYYASFRNCTDDTACDDFILQAYFIDPVFDYDAINAWNAAKRWTKVYFDMDDDVVLEMDVDLRGGITLTNLDQSFSLWALSLPEFFDHFKSIDTLGVTDEEAEPAGE